MKRHDYLHHHREGAKQGINFTNLGSKEQHTDFETQQRTTINYFS